VIAADSRREVDNAWEKMGWDDRRWMHGFGERILNTEGTNERDGTRNEGGGVSDSRSNSS
jgi:hypothetical protein